MSKIARVKFLSVKKYMYEFDDDTIQLREFVKVPVKDKDTGKIEYATAVVADICTDDEAEIEQQQAEASGYTINKGERLPKKYKQVQKQENPFKGVFKNVR